MHFSISFILTVGPWAKFVPHSLSCSHNHSNNSFNLFIHLLPHLFVCFFKQSKLSESCKEQLSQQFVKIEENLQNEGKCNASLTWTLEFVLMTFRENIFNSDIIYSQFMCLPNPFFFFICWTRNEIFTVANRTSFHTVWKLQKKDQKSIIKSRKCRALALYSKVWMRFES